MKISFIFAEQTVEPLGLMYLSAQLKKYGHQVDSYKYESEIKLLDYLDYKNPQIICFSIMTGQHVKLLYTAKFIKAYYKDRFTIIAGGPHVTYFPDIGKEQSIDYYIRGEAEYSLPILIAHIKGGIRPEKKEFGNMKLPVNLDLLPFPDREDIYRYHEFGGNKTRNIMTSRGCPFNCSYCYASAMRVLFKGQKIVRFRSPENIIAECKQVMREYPTEMFFFADDEFSMNIERLKEIKERYIREIKLPFHCQVRIDMLTEERVKIIKEMGCYSLTFAIESGNEDLRKKVLNKKISNEQIIKGASLLKIHGLKFRAENMCGLPNETWQQTLETLRLNTLVKPDYAWISIFQPYPNTVLGDYCRNNNLCEEGIDGIKEKFTEDTTLKMSSVDRKRLINFQRLFGLFVEFDRLKFLFPLLLKLPLADFYTKLRNKWKRYCYSNRLFKL